MNFLYTAVDKCTPGMTPASLNISVTDVAVEFTTVNNERTRYFGTHPTDIKFDQTMCHICYQIYVHIFGTKNISIRYESNMEFHSMVEISIIFAPNMWL